MDEPILLLRGNVVVVGKNSPGKPFHKGGAAFILDPNHKNGALSVCIGGEDCLATKNSVREKLIQLAGNGYVTKPPVLHRCQHTIQTTD